MANWERHEAAAKEKQLRSPAKGGKSEKVKPS